MIDKKVQDYIPKVAIYCSYPITLLIGYAIYALLVDEVVYTIAAYVAAVCGAIFVTLHEIFLPYRRVWRPQRKDIWNDVSYMVVVQILLDLFLGLAFVYLLALAWQSSNLATDALWPSSWPVPLQVMLVLVLADFLRYWLHRSFHKVPWMWRLHAVHHSPLKLYWLNVGRFHPFEGSMQFVFDALPFILLGVAPEVLAAYFVFYAINGFFQHSNCNVRLGWLNSIVAGPELHRWHHSKLVHESDRNFGNNLIIWDTIFQTKYFPKDKEVGQLGLRIPDYPLDFLHQLTAPFRTDLSTRETI